MTARGHLTSAAAAVTLGLLPTAAGAGGVHVARAPGGTAAVAGRPWIVKLVVRPTSFSGSLRVVATGRGRLMVRAAGGRGAFRARLVFPAAGVWTLSALAGSAKSRLGTVTVRPAPPLTFSQPTGIDVQPDGSLLVVEFGLKRLVRVDPASGRVKQLATFTKPWGVAEGGAGAVFVSDLGSVMRLDPGGVPAPVASVAPGIEIGPVAVTAAGDVVYATAQALYLLDHGTAGTPVRLAASVAFDSPHGIAIAADGAVLVSDTNNSRIVRVDLATGDATTFASVGHPRGIDVASDGTVYVSTADEHAVVHLSASGERLAAFGPRMGDPYALAVAPDGTVYTIEAGNAGFIRRTAPDGTASIVTAP